MIKIKILNSLSERAKWRETNFSRELTKKKLATILASNKIENLFVHYDNGVTEKGIPQTTFNPQTIYNTPIGIYAYPMSYVKNKIIPSKNDLYDTQTDIEFASEAKWIYIYKAKNESDVYTFDRIIKESMFEKTVFLISKIHPPDKVFESFISALEEADIKLKSDNLQILKNAIQKQEIIPQGLIKNVTGASINDLAKAWWFFIYKIFNNKVKVTDFLQNKLNIKIIVDNGAGIIHENEPTQAIIFNPAYADAISVELNPWRKSKNKSPSADEKHFALTKEHLERMSLQQIEKYFTLNKKNIAVRSFFNFDSISKIEDKNKAIKIFELFIKTIMNKITKIGSEEYSAMMRIISSGLSGDTFEGEEVSPYRKKFISFLFELLKKENAIQPFLYSFKEAVKELNMQQTPLGKEIATLEKLAKKKK